MYEGTVSDVAIIRYTEINVIYEYVGECENHKIDKFKIIKGALRDDFM